MPSTATTNMLQSRKDLSTVKTTSMKHQRYFRKVKPALVDVSVYATGSETKPRNVNALNKQGQTLTLSDAPLQIQNAFDRLLKYWSSILMIGLTVHAGVDKLASFFEEDVLASKEGLKIMRGIFSLGRNMTPARQQKIQSTIAAFLNYLADDALAARMLNQFTSIASDLYAQLIPLA
jgi:hypothetical protein